MEKLKRSVAFNSPSKFFSYPSKNLIGVCPDIIRLIL